MKKRIKRLPYVFDLMFDCKTEKDVKNTIKYLEQEQKKLESLKKYWDEYKRGLIK